MPSSFLRGFLGRFWGDLGASGYVGLSVGMAIYRYDLKCLGIPKSAVCVRFVRGYMRVRACVYARVRVYTCACVGR